MKTQIQFRATPIFNVLIKCFCTLMCLCIALLIIAQETVRLDLAKTLELAGADNATINMLAMQESLAEAKYDVEKHWWIPDVYAGLDMHQLWGNVMNSDGRIFQDIDRQSFSGALGIGAVFDFGEGIKNKKLERFNSEAKGIISTVARNDFILDVIRHYYKMSGAALEANSYQTLVDQNDTIISQLEVLVREGLHYNTDLLLAQSNRENHSLAFSAAMQEFNTLKFELLALLDLRETSELIVDDVNLMPIDLVTDDMEAKSIPELEYLESRYAAKEFEYKSEKNEVLIPTLRLNAYTSLFGGVFEPIDPTHAINGGIGWDIPLSRLTGDELNVLKIEKSMLEAELQYQSYKADRDIIHRKEELKIYKDQIASAETAVNYSLQAVDESIQRQNLGLARPFEIEYAQDAFLRSRINYIRAIVNYNIKQYELYVKLGNNL